MLNTKEVIDLFLKKKKKYFNCYYLNAYVNMFIKKGKSKFFKKNILKYYTYIFNFRIEKLYQYRRLKLNTLLSSFVDGKTYKVFFSIIKNKIYVNHRKSQIFNITFCILDKKKRSNFFLKFSKYFFLKKKWKKNLKYFFYYNLKNKESIIHDIYKVAFNKIVLKR